MQQLIVFQRWRDGDLTEEGLEACLVRRVELSFKRHLDRLEVDAFHCCLTPAVSVSI